MATTVRKRRPSAPAERLVAEVLAAQGRFFDAARRPSEEFLRQAIELPPGFDPLDAETIRAAQLAYQEEFQKRSAERLRLGLRSAMAQPTRLTLIRDLRAQQRASDDPDVKVRLEQEIERRRREPDPRRQAVTNLLESERRLASAHAAAMAGRARGANRSTEVRALSPTGAFWRRNPMANSCKVCRFMDGKLWPWEVLDQISPPQHPNCECELFTVAVARFNGWISPEKKVPTPRQGISRARRYLQESIEGAVLVEALDRGLLTEELPPTGLRALWREIDVRRDVHGKFADEPGASVGRRAKPTPVLPPKPTETTLAKGYKAAAEMESASFADKMEREAMGGFAKVSDEWLRQPATGDYQRDEWECGPLRVNKVDWGEDGSRVYLDSFMLDHPNNVSRYYKPDDPDLRIHLEGEARVMVEKMRARALPTARKQLRGAIVAPTGPGKAVYDEIEQGNIENAESPRYADLRQRFAHVPDRQMVISESGYGRTGISDVFVTASRSLANNVTSINGPAIATSLTLEKAYGDRWHDGPGSRAQNLKPGCDHITVRSTAALLRHEWGHGLFDDLPDEKRADFIDLCPPDWEEIGEGLSKYAAGTPESRERYNVPPLGTAIGSGGYYTETFAEAVALTTGEDYYPEDWPGWVNRVADWIEDLEP